LTGQTGQAVQPTLDAARVASLAQALEDRQRRVEVVRRALGVAVRQVPFGEARKGEGIWRGPRAKAAPSDTEAYSAG